MKTNFIEERERRFLSSRVNIEVEEREGKTIRKVSGYAAVFNVLSRNLGWFREKIAPGAFDNVLENDVVALFNHDINQILARTISKTLTLSVDEHGLKYEFSLPNTTIGNDMAVMLERGDVQHSSFAFSIEDEQWTEDETEGEIRTVLKVKRLYDVSPVVYPAYTQTDVALAKRSYEEHRKQRDFVFDTTPAYEQELQLLKSLL